METKTISANDSNIETLSLSNETLSLITKIRETYKSQNEYWDKAHSLPEGDEDREKWITINKHYVDILDILSEELKDRFIGDIYFEIDEGVDNWSDFHHFTRK